eukprot:m.182351 g.182351  ORF g.182351 m.182351 type:complete len:705 (-) comp15511_c0_seq1:16-2130(-)
METLAEARRADKARRKKERKAREQRLAQLEAEVAGDGVDTVDRMHGVAPPERDDDTGGVGEDEDTTADDGAANHSRRLGWREEGNTAVVSRFADVLDADAEAGTADHREHPPIRVEPIASFHDLAARRVGDAPLGKAFVDGVLALLAESRAADTVSDAHKGDSAHGDVETEEEEETNGEEEMLGATAAHNPRDGASVPSPIQSAAWACLLQASPPDIVGIAPTGSGKTLAFLIPVVAHATATHMSGGNETAASEDAVRTEARQAAARTFTELVKQGRSQAEAKMAAKVAYTTAAQGVQHGTSSTTTAASPIALVLSPTRELCVQLEHVLEGLLRHTSSKLRAMTVIGGEGYQHQVATLMRTQPHVIVATPGRLLSLCKYSEEGSEPVEGGHCVSLAAVATFVLDEADMMLNVGFEDVVAEFLDMLPKQRWTMLFSATFPLSVRRLAAQVMNKSALYITVGVDRLAAADTVQQRVEILGGKGAPRFRRLCALLNEFGIAGDGKEGSSPGAKVLVFVLYKKEARDIAKAIADRGFPAVSLHGDMTQKARGIALSKFHDDDAQVLVATDVAARGLDIQGISHVINFSLGMSIENYVHRIGRCGRAGRTGIAHSFVVDGDEHLVAKLITVMERTRQPVSQDLRDLAAKYQARIDRQQNQHADPEDDDAVLQHEYRLENEEKQRKLREAAQLRGKGQSSHGKKKNRKHK